MKNVKRLLIGLLAASTLAFSPMSQAQMSAESFYAGIGAGQGKGKDICSDVASIGITSCDDTANGYRIFGGYQFNKNFAVELGYADFGKADASGVVLSVPTSAEWKANAWDVSAVGILPVADKLSVLGRLGFQRWSVDLDINAGGVPISESATGSDWVYGVGLQYDFTRQFGLRGEWAHYGNIGDSDTTGQTDVNVTGVSALFRF